MSKFTWKKVLSLCLCMLMVLSIFTACGNEENTETTEPEVTQSPEEAKVLKVLTIGHSLAVDSGHMLAMVAAAEGYEDMLVGTLYYSGCPLDKHVRFLTNNSPEYRLYISSTKTPNAVPATTEDITMRDGIVFEYWDIIILQGGVFEIGKDETYKTGHIQTIQNYVNEHKLNPNAVFGWHMPWATPTDNELRDMYDRENNTYYSNYLEFNDDRTTFYNAITKCVGDNILTDSTFEYLIPSGTAIENALSSYLTEKDLHRDYAHATDLGRVISAYTWYCTLTGVDHLDELKLEKIPKSLLLNPSTQLTDYVLTEMEKNIILESVNNALANPLQMTQSQYTEAPAA